jgi:hypothetical protein
VQPFEYAWLYPVLYQWRGNQWVQVASDFGWAYAKLPSSPATWTLHQTGWTLPNAWSTRVAPGAYYAVVTHVYFEGSRQWASAVESEVLKQSPIAVPQSALVRRSWCQS